MFHIFLIVALLFHFVVFLRCVVLVVLAFYSFSVLLLLLFLRLFFIDVGSTPFSCFVEFFSVFIQ